MVVDYKDRVRLGVGLDSTVFLLPQENHIMKIYGRLMDEIGPKSCESLVRQYVDDTLKARDAINSEWANVPKTLTTANFNNKEYIITASILPQGTVEIRDEYPPSRNIQIDVPPSTFVVTVGQPYLKTPNFQTYLENVYPNFSYDSLNVRDKGLFNTIEALEKLVVKNTGVDFLIVPENVKFVIRQDNIDMVITDLARSLLADYRIK